MLTQDELAKELGQLNPMQLVALTKKLETEWGVKAVPQTAPTPQKVPDNVPPPADAQTEFDVVITAIGDKKIDVIKTLRTATGLGLKEAKDLIEAVATGPKTIKEGLAKAEAEALKAQFEAAGAVVELK